MAVTPVWISPAHRGLPTGAPKGGVIAGSCTRRVATQWRSPPMRACSAPRADQEADNGKGPNGVDTCPVSHPCDWRSRTAGDSPSRLRPSQAEVRDRWECRSSRQMMGMPSSDRRGGVTAGAKVGGIMGVMAGGSTRSQSGAILGPTGGLLRSTRKGSGRCATAFWAAPKK